MVSAMRSRVLVLVATLVATVLGLLGATSATAAVAPSEVHAYAYDSYGGIADLPYTNTERGPLANGHTSTMASDTVDGLSRVALAHPNNRASGASRIYDAHPHLVQAARATATTAEPAQVTSGDLSSSLRSQIAANGGDEAFHYTFSKFAGSIERTGLRPGSYATPDGTLSPLQAHIDLALPPNRAVPDALIRVDLAGLRSAGYQIPNPSQVGRSFGMPGGGTELQFPYAIPPEFLKVIPR